MSADVLSSSGTTAVMRSSGDAPTFGIWQHIVLLRDNVALMAHLTHEVVRWKGFREAFEDQLFRGLIHLSHQVLLEGGEEQRFANETSTCASQSRYRGVEVQSKAYSLQPG